MIKILIIFNLIALNGFSANAEQRATGDLGVILGAPTGITLAFDLDPASFVFGDLGLWSADAAVNFGFLTHIKSPFSPKDDRLSSHTFLGAVVSARLGDQEKIGIGPALAQDFRWNGSPFVFFVRLYPMLRVGSSIGFDLGGVLGGSFEF